MDTEHIITRLEWYKSRVEELGGHTRNLILKEPATEAEITKLEQELGYRLPEDFRKVLLNFSSHLEFFWSIYRPDREVLALPKELIELFRGDLHFGLDLIPKLEESRKSWISICYPNEEDPYDRVFFNKLAFYDVGNGDLIAIDLEKETYGDIVYLSHDGDEMHGYVLAHSFSELLEEWTKLGCVGGECWQFEPFTNGARTPIDSSSENAKLWLKTIGWNEEL